MSEEAGEKKHDPSEKALQDAGERGELPRSPLVTGVVATVAVAAALALGGEEIAGPIVDYTAALFDPGVKLEEGGAFAILQGALLTTAAATALPLGVAAVASFATGIAQTRLQLAPRAFEARLEHLDPMATFQQIFMSRQPLVELAKGLLQMFALGAVTVHAISSRLDVLPRIGAMAVSEQLALLVDLGWDLVVRAVPVMFLIAGVDYGWSWYTWWQGLMRTDQQAREDAKEQQGDPHVRAHRRRRMREIATRSALAQLKTADVLVTNPTHFAIGLRYRHGVDPAPVVVVKAMDHVALKLRRQAYDLGIPRVEDRALARALYAQVKVGHRVPASLYGPVARVLGVVYRKRKRKGAGGAAGRV
jgi:flagellar biosynthetic protein FlhB